MDCCDLWGARSSYLVVCLLVSLIGGRVTLLEAREAANGRTGGSANVIGGHYTPPLKFDPPLLLVPNTGQKDSRVLYYARAGGAVIYFTRDGVTFELVTASPVPASSRPVVLATSAHHLSDPGDKSGATKEGPRTVVTLRFVHPNAERRLEPLEEQVARVSYFLGNNPSHWRRSLPTYARLAYRNVWPGIDVVFYGEAGRLEYDIVVAPHADISRAQFEYENVGSLSLDASGNLQISTPFGKMLQVAPVIYQQQDGLDRASLASTYVLTASAPVRYGFHTSGRDPTRQLVIDPGLVYSTFVGGGAADGAFDIAADAGGNVYVTGHTRSSDFPTTAGSYQSGKTTSESLDVFVLKLDPGGALVYGTYIGGTTGLVAEDDTGHGIAVDQDGNAYVTGSAHSFDFPTTDGAYQRTHGGTVDTTGGHEFYDAFLAKLDPTGSQLLYSTYLGGERADYGYDIAVDSDSVLPSAYITGTTKSLDFPTTAGAYQPSRKIHPQSPAIGFVVKLSPAGGGNSDLVYGTYLAAQANPDPNCCDRPVLVPYAITLDSGGKAYIGGWARWQSNLETTPNAVSPTYWNQNFQGGETRGFISALSAQGSTLVYSTYFGGHESYDSVTGIAVDPSGHIFVAGGTGSPTTFPTTPGAFQTQLNGTGVSNHQEGDAFIAKIDPSVSPPDALIYSTLLGGTGTDSAQDIAIDSDGNAVVTGIVARDYWVPNPTFPVTATGCQQQYGGGTDDAFVTKLNASGTALLYSTLLGGGGGDQGRGVALERFPTPPAPPAIHVAGGTQSSIGFTTTSGAFQPAFRGWGDAFVAKLQLATSTVDPPCPSFPTPTPTSTPVGPTPTPPPPPCLGNGGACANGFTGAGPKPACCSGCCDTFVPNTSGICVEEGQCEGPSCKPNNSACANSTVGFGLDPTCCSGCCQTFVPNSSGVCVAGSNCN